MTTSVPQRLLPLLLLGTVLVIVANAGTLPDEPVFGLEKRSIPHDIAVPGDGFDFDKRTVIWEPYDFVGTGSATFGLEKRGGQRAKRYFRLVNLVAPHDRDDENDNGGEQHFANVGDESRRKRSGNAAYFPWSQPGGSVPAPPTFGLDKRR